MISQSSATMRFTSYWLVSTLLLTIATILLASIVSSEMPQTDEPAVQSSDGIRVDAETATRMGIKVAPVARQRLAIAIALDIRGELD